MDDEEGLTLSHHRGAIVDGFGGGSQEWCFGDAPLRSVRPRQAERPPLLVPAQRRIEPPPRAHPAWQRSAQRRAHQLGIAKSQRQQHPDHAYAAVLAQRDGANRGAAHDLLKAIPILHDGANQHLLLALPDRPQAGSGVVVVVVVVVVGQDDLAAAAMRYGSRVC